METVLTGRLRYRHDTKGSNCPEGLPRTRDDDGGRAELGRGFHFCPCLPDTRGARSRRLNALVDLAGGLELEIRQVIDLDQPLCDVLAERMGCAT
jgi:hypothetical protein